MVCSGQKYASRSFCSREKETSCKPCAIPETHYQLLNLFLNLVGNVRDKDQSVRPFLVQQGPLCAFKARLLKRVVYTLCLHILCSQSLLTCCLLVSALYHSTKIDLNKEIPGEFLVANTRHTFRWGHTSRLPLSLYFSFLAAETSPSLLVLLSLWLPYLGLPCRHIFCSFLIWEFLRVLSSTLLPFSLNLVPPKFHPWPQSSKSLSLLNPSSWVSDLFI